MPVGFRGHDIRCWEGKEGEGACLRQMHHLALHLDGCKVGVAAVNGGHRSLAHDVGWREGAVHVRAGIRGRKDVRRHTCWHEWWYSHDRPTTERELDANSSSSASSVHAPTARVPAAAISDCGATRHAKCTRIHDDPDAEAPQIPMSSGDGARVELMRWLLFAPPLPLHRL